MLPTSSSKVFPDMLEALESSQVRMIKRTTMEMAMIIVKIADNGNDNDDGNDDDDGNGDDDGNDDDRV